MLVLAAIKALVVSRAKSMGVRSFWFREVVANRVNLIHRSIGCQLTGCVLCVYVYVIVVPEAAAINLLL